MSSESVGRLESGIPAAALEKVPVRVEAFLGTVTTTVGQLSRLKQGEIMHLDRSPGEPVELRLNDMTIAWGELVTVGEHLAVRIRSIAED